MGDPQQATQALTPNDCLFVNGVPLVMPARGRAARLSARVTVPGVLLIGTYDGQDAVPYEPRNSRSEWPSGLPGVVVNAPGFTARDCKIVNVAGTAMTYTQDKAPWHLDEVWRNPRLAREGRFIDLYIGACYNGLQVSSSDALVRGLVAQNIRGWGLYSCGSTTIEGSHCWGCGTGMLLHGACYLSGNVTESCRIGLVNEGGGSQIACHRVFGCSDVGILLRQHAMLSNVGINAGRDSTALKIEQEAVGTVAELMLGLGDNTTGVILSADKTDLRIRRTWGGKATVVIDRPICWSKLDVRVDGSLVGVDIQALGHHNQIHVTGQGCKEPIRLPSGPINESNIFTLNGKPYPPHLPGSVARDPGLPRH